jgi:ribonuclease T1
VFGSTPNRVGSRLGGLGLAIVFAAVVAGSFSADTEARSPVPSSSEATVKLSDLPPQAQTTQRLIYQGGPFPYAKDGSVFGNRERLLPREPRGYYREYTVRTPRARDRGARRIVCGGRPPEKPEACYYTDDHYASFRLIVQ